MIWIRIVMNLLFVGLYVLMAAALVAALVSWGMDEHYEVVVNNLVISVTSSIGVGVLGDIKKRKPWLFNPPQQGGPGQPGQQDRHTDA